MEMLGFSYENVKTKFLSIEFEVHIKKKIKMKLRDRNIKKEVT